MARRSDHTRKELADLIVVAAANLLKTGGADKLTARAVAAEIGYAPGTIYNIYPSMDALYLAVNGRTLDDLHKVLSCATCNDPRRQPLQNMKTMARLYQQFARDNRALWLMLFTHSLPQGTAIPAWYSDKITRLFVPLENLLQPYFGPRQIRPRKKAARVLWAAVHGLCFLEETGKIPLIEQDTTPSPDMTAYLIETFVRGLRTRPE